MKHTKLMILGLTAAMTIGAGTTVFADEIGNASQDTAVASESGTQDAAQQKTKTITRAVRGASGETADGAMQEIDMSTLDLPEDFVPFDENHVPDGKNAPANGELRPIEFDADGNMTFGQKPEDMPPLAEDGMSGFDMSTLELPEDFTPFDENHVPDGKNAPANGELKPIEFDADGNMTFGQKPEGMPPMRNGEMPPMMNGELPELPEGEQPAADGEMPQLPEGEMPPMMNGELPELPEGEQPAFSGELPELPEGEMPPMTNGEMPQYSGEMPEIPENGAQPAGFAQGGQGPVGQLTSFFGWR